MSEIAEMGRGRKLLSIIASAEPLPTAKWLGSIKKYIPAATNTAPKVINKYSLIVRFVI